MELIKEIFDPLVVKPFFILGPCVIDEKETLQVIAEKIVEIRQKYDLNIIFKASFDKANRTSGNSFRGRGIDEGLRILEEIRSEFSLPVTTDIHESYQAVSVGEVVDMIQIPAFLCRQTDLLLAAAKTGKVINIKKAQFLSGLDMKYPLEKVLEAGNEKVMLTERGNMFGYNNLVVDFRNISDMKSFGKPVIMDCTHSVQRPGGLGGKTGGNREFVPSIAQAAKAFGASGYFMETHPNPEESPSDGPNMVYLDNLENIIASLL